MPLYEFECTRCHLTDEVHSNSYRDRPAKTFCKTCGGESFFKISAPVMKDGDLPSTMDRPEQVFRGYPEVVVENAKKYKQKQQIKKGNRRISVGDR